MPPQLLALLRDAQGLVPVACNRVRLYITGVRLAAQRILSGAASHQRSRLLAALKPRSGLRVW